MILIWDKVQTEILGVIHLPPTSPIKNSFSCTLMCMDCQGCTEYISDDKHQSIH